MKTYIKLYFNSEGAPPMEVINTLKSVGFQPVVGNYDFVIEYESPQEYAEILTKLHNALRGKRVSYTLTTTA
ncbi:MAG: hypothetical protein DRN20_01570 [Thermoplasmata archaeon]|nr:MAG: hypothetical protein DRN20_01570 [Thermoplasmata archaeon]